MRPHMLVSWRAAAVLSGGEWCGSRAVRWLTAMLLSAIPLLARSAPTEAEWTVPISESWQRAMGRGAKGRVTEARVWVATPPRFDPTLSWPIVIIQATGDDSYNSSVAWARRYAAAGTAAGWVVVGADATVVVRPETSEYRYGLAGATLEALADRWPGAKDWPIALAGFSGGSKYAGYVGAQLARAGRFPIGLFMGGCNEAAPALARQRYEPPRAAWRDVPVYLSSGDKDPVATPHDHARVHRQLRNDGFRQVRLETYAGAHTSYPPHLTDALQWFAERHSARAKK